MVEIGTTGLQRELRRYGARGLGRNLSGHNVGSAGHQCRLWRQRQRRRVGFACRRAAISRRRCSVLHGDATAAKFVLGIVLLDAFYTP